MFNYKESKTKKSFNLYRISSNKNIYTEYSQQTTSKSNKKKLKIDKSAKILKIKPQKKLLFNIPNGGINNFNLKNNNTKNNKVNDLAQTTSPSLRIKKVIKIPKRNKYNTKNNLSNNSKFTNKNISIKMKENFDIFKNKSFLRDLINLKYNTNENISKIYKSSNSNKKNNNSNIVKKNNSKIRLTKNNIPMKIKERLIFNKKKLKKEINFINNYSSKDNNLKKNKLNQKNLYPKINLILRYKNIKFDMVLTEKDNNSFIIAEKINDCLNLCLNKFQLNYLAVELAKEINNIIKNVIIFPSINNYSSVINLDNLINTCKTIKENNNNYYKIKIKFRNNRFNYIIKENEKNIELIANNILDIINEGGKYQEDILKNVIINNIKRSILKTNSKKSLFSTEESKKY